MNTNTYTEIRNVFASFFPVFTPKPSNGPKKPLAVGIKEQLLINLERVNRETNMAITHSQASKFLERYCSGARYLAATSRVGNRYNLDGRPNGLVEPWQAKYSWEKAKLLSKHKKFKTKFYKALEELAAQGQEH